MKKEYSKVFLGADHAGFALKEKIKNYLETSRFVRKVNKSVTNLDGLKIQKNFDGTKSKALCCAQEPKHVPDFNPRVLDKLKLNYEDLGPEVYRKNDDYPDYAFKVAHKVVKNKNSKGILICGSAAGMCIAANKVKGARAVAAYDSKIAKLAVRHNDANILCLSSRFISEEKNKKILHAFLTTEFSKEKRHLRRLRKIENFEKRKCPA